MRSTSKRFVHVGRLYLQQSPIISANKTWLHLDGTHYRAHPGQVSKSGAIPNGKADIRRGHLKAGLLPRRYARAHGPLFVDK